MRSSQPDTVRTPIRTASIWRPRARLFLAEGFAELGFLVGGQVGADELGVGVAERLRDPVDDGVAAEHEERRRAWSYLLANVADERVADPDVGHRADQRPSRRADGQPEDRNEEDQAEQQSPETAAQRAR